MAGEFERWCAAASVAERCEAAFLLCDALFSDGFTSGENRHCVDALLFLAGDPSQKVRAAMAERLGPERTAPRRLVRLLCQDVDSVAVSLAGATRALCDDDLIELAASGSPRVRCAIARRACVSAGVAGALIACGERVVALELLGNKGAEIAEPAFRLAAARFGLIDGAVREAMLRRSELPAEIRQAFLTEARDALAGMELVRGALGESGARRIVSEACENATTIIAERLDAGAMDAFFRHLQSRGEMTTAFLVRSACLGQIEIFAAALSSLGRLSFARVRAILVEGWEPAFDALCAAAKLPHDVRPLLLAAVRSWRDHASGGERVDSETRVTILERLEKLVRSGTVAAPEPLREMVSRLTAQALREASRRQTPPRLTA